MPYALIGLPRDYEAFINTITNGQDPITFMELRTKLVHQEHRLMQMDTGISLKNAIAYYVQTVSTGVRGGRGYCGKRGRGQLHGGCLGEAITTPCGIYLDGGMLAPRLCITLKAMVMKDGAVRLPIINHPFQ